MIEFPRLGLEFEISREAFKIFTLPIYWYGIIIAFAFILAVILGMRSSKKFGIEPESIVDLVLFAAPVAIVFARLYYVVFNWGEFKDDLLSVFNTRQGGLAIYGGVIGAVIVAYFFARHKKIGVLKLIDFGVPYLVLAQGIGRWGNFVNQEAFGVNTRLPWGMTGDSIREQLAFLQMKGMAVTPDLPVHPTFLYESLMDIGIFLFLIWYRKRKKLEGEVFFLYMILYGIGRAFIEGLRTDSLMLGSLRVSQLLGFLFAISFVIAFVLRRRKFNLSLEEAEQAGSSRYGEILRELEENEKEQDEEGICADDPDCQDIIEDEEDAGEDFMHEEDASFKEENKDK
ncbi:phosphatidylglycerol:prolipoprotein diacylglycerol transferase [Anaerobacterium chartisolvens]|uniref:Phosphatidylglycerol--prolipoprotein diacylglyceryl transferase n=1 Tax=Anaerobacterium chartisolvens TaxID=1297424 RepID=A0A369B7J0_9FIRM|nr:prolipoprotein diacylglyceryl transferase [Anaerobacterium chartisolvens]RCX16568.1 phosphatidylglycerol:prolipoprotein diacylglycerol transferase [Anaerobacterium chartisolvens]